MQWPNRMRDPTRARTHRSRPLVAAVLAGTLAAACGPSAPTTTEVTTSPAGAPTLSEQIRFRDGEARVTVTEPFRDSFRFALDEGLYRSSPAVLALAWGDEAGGLSFQGPTAQGSHETSPTNVLILAVGRGARQLSVTSTNGECRLELERVAEDGVRGGFRCEGLDSAGREFAARGTFTAT